MSRYEDGFIMATPVRHQWRAFVTSEMCWRLNSKPSRINAVSKGRKQRPHFSRPFAPCFAHTANVSHLYLLNSQGTCGSRDNATSLMLLIRAFVQRTLGASRRKIEVPRLRAACHAQPTNTTHGLT